MAHCTGILSVCTTINAAMALHIFIDSAGSPRVTSSPHVKETAACPLTPVASPSRSIDIVALTPLTKTGINTEVHTLLYARCS